MKGKSSWIINKGERVSFNWSVKVKPGVKEEGNGGSFIWRRSYLTQQLRVQGKKARRASASRVYIIRRHRHSRWWPWTPKAKVSNQFRVTIVDFVWRRNTSNNYHLSKSVWGWNSFSDDNLIKIPGVRANQFQLSANNSLWRILAWVAGGLINQLDS